MTAAKRSELLSVEEYLTRELHADCRHEYTGGYVYAMAGGKAKHNSIATNWVVSIGRQLQGHRCQCFNSDMKIRLKLESHTRFYYPDGMVVCESNDGESTFQDQPIIVAEVLSESTRRIDLTEKRDAYLQIPTLAAYMVIETDTPHVMVYQRKGQTSSPADFFLQEYMGLDATIPLPSIAAELPLAELYERITFAEEN